MIFYLKIYNSNNALVVMNMNDIKVDISILNTFIMHKSIQ